MSSGSVPQAEIRPSADVRPSNDTYTHDTHRDSVATAVSTPAPAPRDGDSPPKGGSPTTTVLTLQEEHKVESGTAIAKALAAAEEQIEPEVPGCECKVSQRKKWSLLLVYSLAFFVDSTSSPDLRQTRVMLTISFIV